MTALQTPVSSIMTKKMVTVNPDQSLVDIKHIFEKKEFHHHIPVVENEKLVGIISLVDYMRAIGDATLDDSDKIYTAKKVRDIMSPRPVSMDAATTVHAIAQHFVSGDVHAIVITEKHRPVGIVSTADVIRFLLR